MTDDRATSRSFLPAGGEPAPVPASNPSTVGPARWSERYLVVPKACPDCHQHGQISWCDVSQVGDTETMVIPGRVTCTTDGCPREGGWY